MNEYQKMMYEMHKILCVIVDNGIVDGDLEDEIVELLQKSEDLLYEIDDESIILL